MAVALSENASKQVKQLKEAQKLPETVFLRMGVKGGGCSGMSYNLEFDSEMGPHDKVFEIDGIKVVVDKKSYLYLNGTTLDYVTQGLTLVKEARVEHARLWRGLDRVLRTHRV